jgi:putative heme-binding domain-containing protein
MKSFAYALLLFALPTVVHAAPLELKQGDHVCLIGNTLADRLQHFGWLETYIHARFPKLDLSFRNLGYSGDELSLRLRSANFGTPDQWLTRCKADVIFAFFGYNESFAGKEGLDKFKTELEGFLKHTLAQKYNGQSSPRVVLFSPIAHENLHDRNLPDGKANNVRLKLYTAAMADVAKQYHVQFVNLFDASQALYEKADKPLTINGIHLNEHGDKLLAPVAAKLLFGDDVQIDPSKIEKLRESVNEKNFFWFERYRTVDGYSIYGGRAGLAFVGGQTNFVVMQREMEVLDVMTANRDRRIWAVARGGDLKVDDDNTPPFIDVKTNRPGPLPGGKHLFLSGEDAIKKMTVAKNMKVSLFASEKDFPELTNPVQMQFDTKGRLWVAVWPTYPHWKPKEEMNDKLIILEDTKGTGKADKCIVFADHLHCPTGFEFYNGGVIVAQAPDLMFLKDSKGTGKADIRERILHGLDSADTHHTSNSFTLDPGGALYFQEGTFHHTQVETPYGPPQRCANAGVFRFEPRTQKFDVYVTYGFANPHGHVFDHWGQDIVVDGTGADPFHAALFSGYLPYPQKHNRPPTVFRQQSRPCPGMEYLSSRHFPPEMQGNLLVANVITMQGIFQYKIRDDGSSFAGANAETIVSSTDQNFRPSDLKIGPDGAIWFIDWHNPIIGHMQHNLRDPSRDREHGRIYRVTYNDRPLLQPVKIDGEPIEKLLELLREPEDRTHYRVRIELAARKPDDVIAAVNKWIEKLDPKDKEYQHLMLEALWLHQSHNVVDVDLLKRELASPEFRARAAATRVLSYWRDRVPDALDLVRKSAADEHPRVRLEAIRAASFFTVPEAAEVPIIAAEQPSDTYLDFLRGETMRTLDPIFKKALADGKKINFTTEAGARFLLRNISIEELVKKERTRPVNLELMLRPGVRDEVRREAVRGLAKMDSKSEPRVLLDAVARIDEKKDNRDDSVVFDLVRLLTSRNASELKGVREELEKLALGAHQPVIRQIGFVALINVDNSIDRAWSVGLKSINGLRDLLGAVPLVADPGLRASLYPKIEPLLEGLPKELATPGNLGKTVMGRYIRIELPGPQRTLTLAEVEVFSDGQNVARKGKATQKNTAHGGEASRAIDGNRSGNYSDGGQTHSQEGTKDPWWEVDLGGEVPIESVLIYNRTDGALGSRLNGFTIKVLDRERKTVFEKTKQPAPAVKVAFEVGREAPDVAVRAAAMIALTAVRGQEAKTFQTLAKYVRKEQDRAAAIRAIQRLPRTFWPKEEAGALVDVLLTYIKKVPAAERTTAAALDALEFADALTAFLPPDEGRKVRVELGELGVRVVRVGTLPERMSYDKEVIVIKAGKPVEFILENFDLMPHNFVITLPGVMEEIGKIAEASATSPEFQARQFVPKSNKILLSSNLLQTRETQKLSFTAPLQPGVYPYVCTYPGHWMRMHGALYVVEDLDAYHANPTAYLMKNPLPIKDELLKDTRPRTEWKFEELASAIEGMKSGRSYSNGKQMFAVGTCVACHKMEGVGNEFGPDLTKLDVKMKSVDILKDVIEPSFKINEKYQTFIFELGSGKTVTGIILEETKETVKIIENPLAKAEPLVIKVADIDSRKKSPISMMPKGLLDKLTRDEVLDLIAYIASRGDRKHPLFQGEHDHGSGHQH